MRKNVLPLTSLILSLSLCGCTPSQEENHVRYSYENIKQFEIKYEDIFNQDEPVYFVYIYSLNCLHCELIKNDVISYALSNKIDTKFIKYYPNIPLLDDVSGTIGVKNLDNLGILGTPSLIMITHGEVTLNMAGGELIKNVLKEYY